MKQKYFLILFLFFINFSFGKTFEEINAILWKSFDRAKLVNLVNDEKKEYQETKKTALLLNIKFIESFIADFDNLKNVKLKKLLWIIEHCKSDDDVIFYNANYHLGSLLNSLNSRELAYYYAKQSLEASLKFKNNDLLKHNYSLLAAINYNDKKYYKAKYFYQKAIDANQMKEQLFTASMLNNLSLCYMKLGLIQTSNEYIFKSLSILKRIKDKPLNIKLFIKIVEGNLGSNYFKLNNLNKANYYLNEEITFYIKNNVELINIYKPLEELLKIYIVQKNEIQKNKVLSMLLKYEKIFSLKNNNYNFTEVLFNYYSNYNDLKKRLYFVNRLMKIKTKYSDSIQNNSIILNNNLYSQEIKHLKNQFQSNQKLLHSTLKSKRTTLFLVIVLFTLVFIILIILYIWRNRRIYKNELIQNQKNEIEKKQRIILENEVKLKQEKITSLALNLNLKKETEKTFLEKLKEIKRKKNVEIEDVLKDLHSSVSNLLNIDNKNHLQIEESSEENKKFKRNLLEKHPNLSKHEVNFCTYFRMNLSSKEIANLNNMTDGTIRVYKTKIKTKIGLSQEQKLSDYLLNFQ
jgi:DNA-binding CsgD family transcriptional regulator